ncbi:putative short chain dehydrogenase/reductase [Xylaria bambusicola]|uniref:putative short chain dehydrogenase/reductase n=1 Tax=Xylaria bambusicola TaxID=326684 RepID=UPI002008310C|nr:putative short chain dehydrogenase/reductase [Xylaria bambusicola]KAI0508970.1 putative short chain dehydrogenase/reductase [Xylaria bambusicola]
MSTLLAKIIHQSTYSVKMVSNKTVILVTGANSGIGFETAKALATASPDFHVLLGSRSVEKVQKAIDDIKTTLGDSIKAGISALQIDVCDHDSIKAAKDQIETQFGKLDVLINNAGIIVYEKVDALTSLRRTFETNVFGQLITTETMEPLLQKSAKPYVVYVSSEQGSISERLNPEYKYREIRGDHYRMSKAALNMLSACHRYNYADWGCRVLAFNPGWCVSNLTGEKGREMRIKLGARDPKDPAIALVDVVFGKRDADIEKNGLVDLDGGVRPW